MTEEALKEEERIEPQSQSSRLIITDSHGDWHDDWNAVPWRAQLDDVITDAQTLLELVGLSGRQDVMHDPAFPIRIPRRWARRIKRGDPNDPILLQTLALSLESLEVDGYSKDPLSELGSMGPKGVIHKYASRVLLVTTGACAVNCRYCFRREFPYADNYLSQASLQPMLDYIRNDTQIFEVILSGGDPLMASNQRLRALVLELANIEHVTHLRIHTRIPVMVPQRLDTQLIDLLRESGLTCSIVLHCNHAQELSDDLGVYVRACLSSGVMVYNQTVLLKNINDTIDAQFDLSITLSKRGVIPYYLHCFDAVRGASHFDVPLDVARDIYKGLLAKAPGYLVPRLVKEIPGKKSKIPLGVFG